MHGDDLSSHPRTTKIYPGLIPGLIQAVITEQSNHAIIFLIILIKDKLCFDLNENTVSCVAIYVL